MQQGLFAQWKLFHHSRQRWGSCRPVFAELNERCFHLWRIERSSSFLPNRAIRATHPATSCEFVRKPSHRSAGTGSAQHFRFAHICDRRLKWLALRFVTQRQAQAQAALFRAFETQPGSCRPVRRQVREEHPARSLHAGTEFENIQFQERGYQS